jgi:hypothetical protein
MTVHRRLLDRDPSYLVRRERLENFTLSRTCARDQRRTETRTIPVVVHVVYFALTENISTTQVASQIDVLNADFSGRNADVRSLPRVWRDAAADARIVFKLADRDPGGGITSGITRTATRVATFGDDDAMKFAATGGAAAWPSDRYLNIWVCHLNDLLGYAQLPGGPAQTDGVVVDYRAFGTSGTAEAPFNLGRTATHEVGHWLNLLHVWGDDGAGGNGPEDDTFVNFMDYFDDRSMMMFSGGQVERMHAALDSGIRSTRARQAVR